jgi:hypothetical protein
MCCYLCFLLLFMLFYVLFVCRCVLYYCHRVATQLQLNIYISYHIISYIKYISYLIISYIIISYHIASYHITHHIIYHIILYLTTSHHIYIISYTISYQLSNHIPYHISHLIYHIIFYIISYHSILIWYKMSVLILYTNLYEIFLILKINERNMNNNVLCSSSNVPLLLSDFKETWIFSSNFINLHKCQIT